MKVNKFDHYNIDTAKPQETIEFYEKVLGFRNAPELRPNFTFPGAWMVVGGHTALHINFIETPPAAETGAFNHIAFEASGFAEFRQHLDGLGVEYRVAEVPGVNLQQIFVRDPNGIRVELNIRGEM